MFAVALAINDNCCCVDITHASFTRHCLVSISSFFSLDHPLCEMSRNQYLGLPSTVTLSHPCS